MFSTWTVFGGLALWCAPYSPAGWDCFELVKQLNAPKISERERIQAQLMSRPQAVWAVFWGFHHDNAEIFHRSMAIRQAWKDRREARQLADLVRSAGGDFDRFLNSFLAEPDVFNDPFASACDASQAFTRYVSKHSLPFRIAPGDPHFPTPFQDFAHFMARGRPKLVRGPLAGPPARLVPPPAGNPTFGQGPDEISSRDLRYTLVRCSAMRVDRLSFSIVITDGDVEVYNCAWSIVIAGGNVTVSDTGDAMIFAAGDVKLGPRGGVTGRTLVIAGGTVSGIGVIARSLLVTPNKTGRLDLSHSPVLLHGKPKPAPDLFTFRDLWADYGLEAALDNGRVKITKAKAEGPFSHLLKLDDLIQARQKQKIESVGQFRRLLGHALDTGTFDFEIERAGKTMSVRATLDRREQ